MLSRTRISAVTAAAILALAGAPTAAAQDPECDIIMPAADRLETVFNQVSAGAPPKAGIQVQIAESPLFGLTSPAAIDLRLWSGTVADQLNGANPYHTADLGTDLDQARQRLAAAREYCAP